MSTLVVGTLKSDDALPPIVHNSGGTEIGTFCRAWVNFNGTGTVAIRASFNVTSITDNNPGDYTVNFTTAISDANYAAVVGAALSDTDARFSGSLAKTTTTCAVETGGISAGAYSSTDAQHVTVAIFR